MREVYFTLIKEAPSYIRIRLEHSVKKICVNVPKEYVKNFNRKHNYAFFDNSYLSWAFHKEMRALEQKELLQERAYAQQLTREKKKENDKTK